MAHGARCKGIDILLGSYLHAKVAENTFSGPECMYEIQICLSYKLHMQTTRCAMIIIIYLHAFLAVCKTNLFTEHGSMDTSQPSKAQRRSKQISHAQSDLDKS